MATIKFIAEETARARTKHPKRPVVELIEHYFDRFKEELVLYRDNRGDALRVFTTGGTLAAMVIRIIEEGAANYNYPGNKLPGGPLLERDCCYLFNGCAHPQLCVDGCKGKPHERTEQ